MAAVLELQREALDDGCAVSALLRKALVVARKLHLPEFEQWVNTELRGYDPEKDEVPSYREVSGQVKAWNPFHGWVTVMFGSDEHANFLSHRKCSQSVAELEALLDGKTAASELYMPFQPELQRMMRKATGERTDFALFTSHTEPVKILNAVRTIILNWALKLEEDGILGEGLLFSKEEKERAQRAPQNIANFFGPVHHPTLQQGGGNLASVSVDMGSCVRPSLLWRLRSMPWN
jgi:hypothetical protein